MGRGRVRNVYRKELLFLREVMNISMYVERNRGSMSKESNRGI
jgi:hypothetical protein